MTHWTPITAHEAAQHYRQVAEVLDAALAEIAEKRDFLARRNIAARSPAGNRLMIDLSACVGLVQATRDRLDRWARDARHVQEGDRPQAAAESGDDAGNDAADVLHGEPPSAAA